MINNVNLDETFWKSHSPYKWITTRKKQNEKERELWKHIWITHLIAIKCSFQLILLSVSRMPFTHNCWSLKLWIQEFNFNKTARNVMESIREQHWHIFQLNSHYKIPSINIVGQEGREFFNDNFQMPIWLCSRLHHDSIVSFLSNLVNVLKCRLITEAVLIASDVNWQILEFGQDTWLGWRHYSLLGSNL